MTVKSAEKSVAFDAPDERGFGGGGPHIASKDDRLKGNEAALADPDDAVSIKSQHTEVASAGDGARRSGTWDGTFTDPRTRSPARGSAHRVAADRKPDQDARRNRARGRDAGCEDQGQ